MKKADFFVDEFISKVISKEANGKNEWQKIKQTLLFVKSMQVHWHRILLNAIENQHTADKLACETAPTHIEDETLYVKVTNADEIMLIALHAKAIITHIKKTYEGSKNDYEKLSESFIKIRPVYNVP